MPTISATTVASSALVLEGVSASSFTAPTRRPSSGARGGARRFEGDGRHRPADDTEALEEAISSKSMHRYLAESCVARAEAPGSDGNATYAPGGRRGLRRLL